MQVWRYGGALLLFLLLAGEALAGQVSHHRFHSETLGRDYLYTLYLPDGYQGSGREYPVIYLLHGSFGNDQDWVNRGALKAVADRLIRRGRIPPAVIVMPGSQSWWVDGHNERARTAFFDDLLPHVEALWRVVPEREWRAVAGLSAGGYGAINFILERPELFAAAAAGHARAADRKPNIVVILADDLGYGDVGCFGAKNIKTPNLDRMAREGTRFTSFYVAQPVCTASRAALLSGCYPNRIGLQGALNHTSPVGINAQETLLSRLAKLRGYATAIFGKWHLGDNYPHRPMDRGFHEAKYHKGWGITSAPEFASTLIDGLLPGMSGAVLGYDANDPDTNFSPDSNMVFRGVKRKGLDQLHIGLAWAPLNQAKDDTKPTWVIGTQVRWSIGKIMRFRF